MTLVPVRRLLLCLVIATGSVACGKKETPAEESAENAEKVDKTEGELSAEPDASESAEDAAAKDHDTAEGKRKNPRDRLTGRRPPPRGRDKLGEPADGEAVDGEPAGTDKDPKDAKVDPADPTKPLVDGKVDPADPAKVADPKLPPDTKNEVKSDPALPSDVGELPPENHKAEPPVHGAAQPLDAQRAMPLQAVIDATQAKGLSDAGTLPGIATGPGYVSILYKGPAADKFGIALQAWQDPARREADDRFRRMRLQYPNAEDVQVLQPAKAFFAHFGGIQMLTFVDSVKRIVATVSCGEDLCTHEQLTKLAKSVREKL